MSDRLAEWRQALAPRELTLSSGLTVLIRPVPLINLIMSGVIQLTLMCLARGGRPTKSGETITDEAIKMTPVIDIVVMAAVIDPPVTSDGAGDSIAVADIDYSDRVTIFEEANRPAAALQPFREQPNGDVGTAPDSEGVREAAE